MQKLMQKIAEILRLFYLEKRWKKIAGFLAIIVVFCTTYMLILPAITMEKQTFCGLEEHTHSSGCFSVTGDDTELLCGMDEHKHSENCFVSLSELQTDFDEPTEGSMKQKVFSDKTVKVTAVYNESADIPDNAQLIVKKIENSGEYDNCYKEAMKAIESAYGEIKTSIIKDFQLYDISFVLLGEEIQPKDNVDISISFPTDNMPENAEVSVVHYDEDGPELSKVQTFSVDKSGNLNTSFETDSFSLFAVVTSETEINSVVALSAYGITDQNITSLGGKTYAILSGEYALSTDDEAVLVSEKLSAHENGTMVGNEAVARWTFTRNGNTGSNYYISTQINEETYYLMLSGNTISLTDNQSERTSFTATGNNDKLLLGNDGDYINISSDGVKSGSSSALDLYSVPTGQFTVTFDGQLGLPTYMSSSNKKFTGAEKLQVTTDSQGYVTLPSAENTKVPGNYPMRLNGWYDIVNKIYYDSSMLGKQIRVTNDTIFYAEWIAETYDIGQNVDVVEGQPDTSSFITTKVFDYNELFNMHSANYSQSSGTWTFDPDSELGFIFFDYLTTGNIGNINDKNVAVNGVTVNAEKTNGKRGSSTNFPGTITPGIANDARINALFGPDNIPGRIALGEGDWLYSYDEETGYYYYNSAKNATSYNQSEQRFYVYDYVVNIDSQNSLNDFLPFNYGKDTYKEKDNEANYWFGMSSEITFYLPEDSGSGMNIAANGVDDMQLRFSGDDDVWIFIDGQLVLDLGGVHDVVYGEVNFSTGKVKTGQAKSSTEVADNTAADYSGMPGISGTVGITTTDLPMKLEGGKEHTITVYYLERGSSLSNCAIYFNLSPSYILEITKKDKNGEKLLSGAKFGIFDDEACTEPSSLYSVNEDGTLTENSDSIFTVDEHGIARCWGLLSDKIYYIKEVEPPPGYPDMSDYVIKVDLNEVGKATFIATDSNGGQWTFADSYTIASDDEHKIELNVYNDFYTGGEKKLYVEKIWADGSTNIPENITVRLYANGEETSRTMTLNAENGWKGVFYELPESDADGNEIEYSVAEDGTLAGYVATYEKIKGSQTITVEVPAHFEQITSLENGGIYRFVSASTGKAVSMTGSSAVGPGDVSEDNAQLWTAVSSGNGFRLRNNSYTNRYLNISRTSVSTTTSNIAWTFSNNRMQRTGYNYYLRDGTSATSNYRVATSTGNASTFYAYKYIEASVETEVIEIEDGWRITNTPKFLDIPVEKNWYGTVSDENKKEINISLYLVSDGVAERKDSLLLNSSNNWQGSFSDIPYPAQGSYYCIIEDTNEFSVLYSGKTDSVLINNENHTVAVVEFDDNGDAVKISITNYPLVLLPDTGGSGYEKYIIGGLLTVLSSVFLLCYIVNRERRRKRSAV